MTKAYLGLGSNLGDRRQFLAGALRALAADPARVIVRGSSVYESKPFGVTDQPDFLNLVAEIETTHTPPALLAACLGIEAGLGRERRERWGPRVIDLDVLLFGNLAWNGPDLVLPHPGLSERNFVLTPLAEIAPDLEVNGQRVRDLAARAGTAGLNRVGPWADLAAVAGLTRERPATNPVPAP